MDYTLLFIMWKRFIVFRKIKTCTHSQSGLTALKVAQSEARQDVCGILVQYSQQGAKVTTPEQSESRREEERTAELVEVGMDDNRCQTGIEC